MAAYSENYNLILPEADDYYDVDVFNQNFKTVDSIVASTGNETIVVATYDTKSQRKARADYVCTSTDACQVIQGVIDSMSAGDELLLLDGTYYIRSETDGKGIVVDKAIKIVGRGIANTKIIQAEMGEVENYSGETSPVLTITSDNVVVENLMISDNTSLSSPQDMVHLGADGAVFKNVFFVQNMNTTDTYYIVKNTAQSKYTRIQDCRVYRMYDKSDLIMFDFSEYDFSGVITGNLLSGYNNLSFDFNTEGSRNKTVVYGNDSVEVYVNGVLSE